MKNVITFGKLISLLLMFCLPLLHFLSINIYTKITRNEFVRPVMATIFLVIITKVKNILLKNEGLLMVLKRTNTREMLSSLCHKNINNSLKTDKYMTAIPT